MKVIIKVSKCQVNEELTSCIKILPDNSIILDPPSTQETERSSKEFSFDAVFTHKSRLIDVYEPCSTIVDNVLRGQNGAILTFGQVSICITLSL